MNKIEQMLWELCPNGVEYKKLEDIGCLFSGLTGKSKEDFKDGNAKFVSYMNVYSNPALNLNIEDKVRISDEEEQNAIQYGDILFTGSSETPEECGMTSIVTQKVEEAIYLNSFCFGLRLNNVERFDVNFLKHLFRCDSIRKLLQKTANGVTRFNVSKKRLLKIEIPVPPLEVQTQIAYILDHFTELTAELQARQEQYEYYRNKLLTFTKIGGGTQSVTWMKMSEICSVYTGGEMPKSSIVSDVKTGLYKYPIYANGKDVYGYSDSYRIKDDAVCISSIGANAGTVFFKKGCFTPIIRLKVIVPITNMVNTKYLYYAVSTLRIKTKGNGGIPNINANDIKKLLVPIPSFSEQQRIVSILDKFETLVNDLSQGLPAEIAAVQEQYEYYRNKLLTFKRIA